MFFGLVFVFLLNCGLIQSCCHCCKDDLNDSIRSRSSSTPEPVRMIPPSHRRLISSPGITRRSISSCVELDKIIFANKALKSSRLTNDHKIDDSKLTNNTK